MLVSGIGVEDEYTKFEHAVVTSIGQSARFYHTLPFLFRVNGESEDNPYSIQLVGADYFDEDSAAWACDTPYSSAEDLFILADK